MSQDTPITIKISVNDSLKKLKLPLRDLGANVLPDKVCEAANDIRDITLVCILALARNMLT